MWEWFWQWFLEHGNQRFLIGIGLALGIGFAVGFWKRRSKVDQPPLHSTKGDEAFLKGIRYVFSNDHDHAIEEFTKAVQINSDTIETYVALGNLYRSKGDIDRAIRIRQNIILRPNIDEQIKLRALYDLGLDYKKGGFLNRALEMFLKLVQKDPSNLEVLAEIERICEELKDWERAYDIRKKIDRLSKKDDQHILAHHLVEMGKVKQQEGDLKRAESDFKRAISAHNGCVDAFLHLGDLYFIKQEYNKAVSSWKKVAEVSPQFTFLAYRRLEGAYAKMEDLKPVEDFLKECAVSYPDAFTHLALARYLYNEHDIENALEQVSKALELDPSFWRARKFKGEILLSQKKYRDALKDYGELIGLLDMPYLKFQCRECGLEANELQWQCPQCKKWDTVDLIK